MTEVVGRLLFGPNVDNCDGESGGFVSGETKEYEMTATGEEEGRGEDTAHGNGRKLRYSGDGSGFMEAAADDDDDDDNDGSADAGGASNRWQRVCSTCAACV